MIFGYRVAKTKLVEQLTLVTLQTAHHGSTSPRFASTQRNHASRHVSTDFCNKICHKRKNAAASNSTAGRSRLHRLNLSRAPSLVEPRFKRTLQPQEGVPPLPRDRLHPVCFLARGSLWSEINVHRTIRIDQQSLCQTTDSRGLLIGLEHRACLVIVERERPEILGR